MPTAKNDQKLKAVSLQDEKSLIPLKRIIRSISKSIEDSDVLEFSASFVTFSRLTNENAQCRAYYQENWSMLLIFMREATLKHYDWLEKQKNAQNNLERTLFQRTFNGSKEIAISMLNIVIGYLQTVFYLSVCSNSAFISIFEQVFTETPNLFNPLNTLFESAPNSPFTNWTVDQQRASLWLASKLGECGWPNISRQVSDDRLIELSNAHNKGYTLFVSKNRQQLLRDPSSPTREKSKEPDAVHSIMRPH